MNASSDSSLRPPPSSLSELRVFISSTFRDLQEEREHLVKKVFPEIRGICRERGIAFTEIDLRWGLTEEESTLGRTIRTCLEEVERCRPYFIGITGDRYGYIPKLHVIYKDGDLLERYPWVEDAATEEMSIMEMEIRYGALNSRDEGRGMRDESEGRGESAFFYFRQQRERLVRQPLDGELSGERERLELLKQSIRSSGLPVREFRDPATLGELVYDDLIAIIKRDFADVSTPTPLEQERRSHEAFAASRRHAYIPNPAYQRWLNEFANPKAHHQGSGVESQESRVESDSSLIPPPSSLSSDSSLIPPPSSLSSDSSLIPPPSSLSSDSSLIPPPSSLSSDSSLIPPPSSLNFPPPSSLSSLDSPFALIFAPSGSGKSALLAHWAQQYRRKHPRAFVIEHYVGIGGGSADHLSILRHIILEIRERYQITDEVPVTPEELQSGFPEWLARTQAEPLVILLDGLNQLPAEARELAWLPEHFPPNVRLAASTTSEEMRRTLAGRRWRELTLQPLTTGERESVVVRFLSEYHKALNSSQVQCIAGDSKSAHPLFLRTLLEELRLFGSFEELDRQIDWYLSCTDTHDLFQRVLKRLEGDFGERAVSDVMSLIWASREGLSESELSQLTMLSRLRLTALIAGLEFHLVRRNGLLTFFHDYLRDAVEKRYVGSPEVRCHAHVRLGDYFSTTPVSPRRAAEEPWQWKQAGEWRRLRECVGMIPMFRLLVDEQQSYELMGYWLAIGDRADMVETYRASLVGYEREHPDLTDLATALTDLGKFLSDCNRYDEAESYCRRSLAFREKSEDDAGTAASLDALAEVLQARGKREEAIPLLKRALKIRTEKLGTDGSETVHTLQLLGTAYYAEGEHDLAEEYLQKALALAETRLGSSHLVTTRCLNDIGAVATARGSNARALSLFLRALTINEAVLGPFHPEVASNLLNIVSVLVKEERLEDAEQMGWRALAIHERVFGSGHLTTAHSLSYLGSLLRERGNLDISESLLRQALEIRERWLGREHIDTITSMMRLAGVLKGNGKYPAAISMYRETIALRRSLIDRNDSLTQEMELGLKKMEEMMLRQKEL